MRTIHLRRQPAIIDVTPEGEPIRGRWWQRAKRGFLTLLAAMAVPILLALGFVAMLAVVALGTIAIAIVTLLARLERSRA